MKTEKANACRIRLMTLKHAGILLFIACALLISNGLLQAQAGPPGTAHIQLPANLSGIHNGAEYVIRVPANWNGTLLVYAHGTGTGAVEVVPPTSPASTLQEQLLSRGYALAGCYYNKEVEQTHALTEFFKGQVGNPKRIIVWGLSWGGDAALALTEKYPGIYDGAIPVSAEAGGQSRYADFLLRYALAYAAAFGWPADAWGHIEDMRDDLMGNEGSLIAPYFAWETFNWYDPSTLPGSNYPQWEFIRLVMKEDEKTWYEVEPALWLSGLEFLGWAATARRSSMEQFAGGPVAQNIGVVYKLAPDEKAHLATLGVNADELLAWMNAHTNITARHSSRNRLGHSLTPSGDLRKPVLIMQGIHDPIVSPSNQAVYRDLIEAAGNGDQLVQTYVDTWHADFTAEHYLATLAAMEHWLDTGEKPDATFFPQSLGFDNSFVPPPWPY